MSWTPADEIGERDPLLPAARQHLAKFSYGVELKGTSSEVIDADYLAAQRQFKNNVHNLVAAGRRPGPDVNPDNPAFDWATKKQMGLLPDAPAPGARPFIAYNFPGTWGAWNNGFGWDVCMRLDPKRFDVQGLGYNTTAFMIGTVDHSYVDMLNAGRAEFYRLALPNRQRKVLCGYSGGAGALVHSLEQWPADRRHEIAAVVQFGDPNRPPGKTLLGNDPGGHGISEDFPPDWVLDRYYSFTLPGDMYPNAQGLLPIFYDILVRMEATPEFATYLFNLFMSQAGHLTVLGGALLGKSGNPALAGFGMLAALLPLLTGGKGETPNLVAMFLNIGNIVVSLKKLLQFLISGDHGKYLDPGQRVFNGLTAVDRAAQIINSLT